MNRFIKKILSNLNHVKIKKAIIFSCLISIIIPFILPLTSKAIFGNEPSSNTLVWSLNYDSKIPIFLEVSMAEISLLWIIIRFIPFIIFGFVNMLIIEKISIKRTLIENFYLIVSSTLFYLLTITPIFKMFLYLDSISFFRFIFELTDAFNF